MSFLTLKGTLATNPHQPAHGDSCLLLTCPTVADTLVLFEFLNGQKPYQSHGTGWDASDGRSLRGAIRTKGNNYSSRRRIEAAFLVNAMQATWFDAMLEAQRQDQTVTVVDNWRTAVTRTMWIDVADRYLSEVSPWYLLQFTAWEI
jgi:hypothetical protein